MFKVQGSHSISLLDTLLTDLWLELSSSREGKPLLPEQVEDLYARVDWRVVMLDEEIHRASGDFHPLSMFRALALPFLIKIPSEMALVRELDHRPELRRLCLFSGRRDPGNIPTRGITWRFRHYPKGFYSRVMLKLLIDMMICNHKSGYSLPFVRPLRADEALPKTSPDSQWVIEGFFADVWETSPRPTKEPITTAQKTVAELAREMRQKQSRTAKQYFSSELPLPAKVKVATSAVTSVRFWIDRPPWLKAPQIWRLRGTDTLTGMESNMDEKQTYFVCNALLFRNAEGAKQILLSKRLSGLGKGSYTLPGGKQDENETLLQCVNRELREETGLRSQRSRPISFFTMRMQGKPKVVVVGAVVDEFSGNLRQREPDQNDVWEWYDLDHLPRPLFPPTKRIIGDYIEDRFPNLSWHDLEPDAKGRVRGFPEQLELFNGNLRGGRV